MKDADYADYGTPEIHNVPHVHVINIIDDYIDRKKGASDYGNY